MNVSSNKFRFLVFLKLVVTSFCIVVGMFSFLAAQPMPVWYKNYSKDLRKENFSKLSKNNTNFTLVKLMDTLAIPQITSILVLDKKGAYLRELPYDTADYVLGRDFILVGKQEGGEFKMGVSNLKGELLLPLDFMEIHSSSSLFLVKDSNRRWGVYDAKGVKRIECRFTDIAFSSFGSLYTKNQFGCGAIDEFGKVLVENKFQEIRQLSADSFEVKEPDRWDYLDTTKRSRFSWVADSIRAYNDTLFIVYSNGRAYLKDSLARTYGNEEGYMNALPFVKGLLLVNSNGYYGLITTQGKTVLPMKYYRLEWDTAGYIRALGDEVKATRYKDLINKNKRRWTVFSANGKLIIQKQFKQLGEFREGVAAFQNDQNLWGYISNTGKVLIAAKYSTAEAFRNKVALVTLPNNNEYRAIDKTETVLFYGKEAQLYYLNVIRYRACNDSDRREGEPEVELFYGVPPYRYDSYRLAECGYIRVKNGTYTGVLHPEGFEVVQAYQDTVYKASADTFFLYTRTTGLVGYSDRYGNTAMYLTNKFERVEPLQEGYSRFKKDGLYGFVDAYGNIPIAPKYDDCKAFSDGMAPVFLKGRWGFVDKQENLLVQPYYKEVHPFRNGFAPVKTVKNKWIFVGKDGKPLTTPQYDDYWRMSNGFYIVVKARKWGLNDTFGKELLSPKYEYIEVVGDSLVKVKKDGKYGLMDFDENIKLYYQYDNLRYNPYTKGSFVMTFGRRYGIKVMKEAK